MEGICKDFINIMYLSFNMNNHARGPDYNEGLFHFLQFYWKITKLIEKKIHISLRELYVLNMMYEQHIYNIPVYVNDLDYIREELNLPPTCLIYYINNLILANYIYIDDSSEYNRSVYRISEDGINFLINSDIELSSYFAYVSDIGNMCKMVSTNI